MPKISRADSNDHIGVRPGHFRHFAGSRGPLFQCQETFRGTAVLLLLLGSLALPRARTRAARVRARRSRVFRPSASSCSRLPLMHRTAGGRWPSQAAATSWRRQLGRDAAFLVEKRRLAPAVHLVDTRGTVLHEVLAEPQLSFLQLPLCKSTEHSGFTQGLPSTKPPLQASRNRPLSLLLLTIEPPSLAFPTPRTHPGRWVWPSLAA